MKTIISNLIKKYWFALLLMFILSIGFGVLQVLYNILLGQFIDTIISGEMIFLNNNILIKLLISTLLIVSILYLQRILNVSYGSKMMHYINYNLLRHLQKVKMGFFDDKNTNYITQEVNIDSYAVSSFLYYSSIEAIKSVLITLIILLYLINVSFKLFAIVTIGISILYVLYIFLKKKIYELSFKYRTDQSKYQSNMFAMICNIEIIKANVIYDELANFFSTSNNKFEKSILESEKFSALFENFSEITIKVIMLILFYKCQFLIFDSKISIGTFIVISMLINILISSISNIFNYIKAYQEVKVNYNRLDEYMSIPLETNGNKKIEKLNSITVSNLSFSYNEDIPVLKDINITLEKGNIYHLRGKNGTGKSTFISILIGILQKYSGNIFYNDVDLKEVDIYNFRKNKLSYVEQHPIIELLSLKDNVTLGVLNYNEEQYDYLLNRFNLDNINELRKGILNRQTLSGGQKQKIVLTRAFLKNGDLIILDEPTSALDADSVKVLKQLILDISKDKIIIIISHDQKFSDVCNITLDFDK